MQIKKIRTKIVWSILVIVLLALMLGLFNYFILYKGNEKADEVANEQLPLLIAGENLNMVTANLISLARGHLLGEGDFKTRFDQRAETCGDMSSKK